MRNTRDSLVVSALVVAMFALIGSGQVGSAHPRNQFDVVDVEQRLVEFAEGDDTAAAALTRIAKTRPELIETVVLRSSNRDSRYYGLIFLADDPQARCLGTVLAASASNDAFISSAALRALKRFVTRNTLDPSQRPMIGGFLKYVAASETSEPSPALVDVLEALGDEPACSALGELLRRHGLRSGSSRRAWSIVQAKGSRKLVADIRANLEEDVQSYKLALEPRARD